MINNLIDLLESQNELHKQSVGEYKSLENKFIQGLLTESEFYLGIQSSFMKFYRMYEYNLGNIFCIYTFEVSTINGRSVSSRIRPTSLQNTFELLNLQGGKDLDWGNIQVIEISRKVFDSGYPIWDVIHSESEFFINVRGIRNFINHYSAKSIQSFEIASMYFVGSKSISSAGEILSMKTKPGIAPSGNVYIHIVDKLTMMFRAISYGT